MGTIILLRHGQASFGARDYDNLSALGRRQSQVAGQALAARGLRDPMVLHGTLRRQRDTATLAMGAMGIDGGATVDARWDEYDHIGMVTAQVEQRGVRAPVSSKEFQAILDEALTAWITDDDADGWAGFRGGAVTAVTQLGETLGSGRDAVVVTSGGIIAAIAAHLLHGGPKTVIALNRVIVNASLTTLLAGRSGLSLLSFNEHTHLTGDASSLRTYR